MKSIDSLVKNYLDDKISYSQSIRMLKTYLRCKNISRKKFDETVDTIEGFELTKDIESGDY